MITPKTKILDLLREYPQLEEVLFDISPAFRQLKNPVLRRTVARVTTLQQAAIVGGLKVEVLVNLLREKAVEAEIDACPQVLPDRDILEEDVNQALQTVPPWFDVGKISGRLDARDMLNRGEHPVGQVLGDLQKMPDGEIFELTAPFNPAPLIDKAAGLGYRHWIKEVGDKEFKIWFIR